MFNTSLYRLERCNDIKRMADLDDELLSVLMKEVSLEDAKTMLFCHLCGHPPDKHHDKKHKYEEHSEEYRCITCGLWTYQHLRKDSVCFDEYIRS